MTQFACGERAAEDSAGTADFGIEDFFDLGCGALSRFSNHRVRSLVILCREDMTRMDELFGRDAVEANANMSMLRKTLTGGTEAQGRSKCARSGTIPRGQTFGMRSAIAVTCVVFGFGSAAHTRTSRQVVSSEKKETVTAMHASGTFEVKLNVQKADNKEEESAKLGRMSLDKQFNGDLEGTSAGEMLSVGTEVKGSAGYVAMERVRGTLHGRAGTFALQHSGTMTRGEPQLSVTVVPDSGTGELAGIVGKMAIKIVDRKHFYEFEYTLPETP
jgi:hypothetical protein